jgi:hypothetical protein
LLRKTAQKLAFGATIVALGSLAMAVVGETEAMLAWWMAIVLLLPLLLWAFKTRHIALITISLITFFSQFFTLPFFYIGRDDFLWGHVKPFGFSAWEAFPMLSKVMLFIVCLILFFRLLYRLTLYYGSSSPCSCRFNLQSSQLKQKSFIVHNAQHLKPSRNTYLYTFLLVLVIAILVPLNLWMFSQGIGIVGVESPRLPFRLTGILHYLTKYLIPLLIAFLYWKTKRDFFNMAVMLLYALILGLSNLSRGTLILVMLPVLAAAWLDRRLLLLMIAGLGAFIGVASVNLARNFVYIVTAGKTGAITDSGILSIISSIFEDTDGYLRRADFHLSTFVAIFDRFDGFSNLVMSHFYDPYAVNGPMIMILGMIWQGLAPVDLDVHHIQWQGNVLPEGFMNGGSLLSSVVIIGNANLLWIFLFAFIASCILVSLEKSVRRVAALYGLSELVATMLIGMLSIFFFNSGGGSVTFVWPLLLLLVASWLPPLRFNWLRQRRQRFGKTQMH